MSLEDIKDVLSGTTGTSLLHYREIFETSRFFPKRGVLGYKEELLTIMRLYQKQNATIMLSMGSPMPTWMNPELEALGRVGYKGNAEADRVCFLPEGDDVFEVLKNNMSESYGLMLNTLWNDPAMDRNWIRQHVMIDPFNELDSLPTGPSCRLGDTRLGQRAAALSGGIQHVMNRLGLPIVVTMPSGATGNLEYFRSFYSSGGLAMANLHYYYNNTGRIDDPGFVDDYINHVVDFASRINDFLPEVYKNQIILGEFGVTTLSAGCHRQNACGNTVVSGQAQSQFLSKFFSDPRLKALMPVRMSWELMDMANDPFTYGMFRTDGSPKDMLYNYLLQFDGVDLLRDPARLPRLKDRVRQALVGVGAVDLDSSMYEVLRLLVAGEGSIESLAEQFRPSPIVNNPVVIGSPVDEFLFNLYRGLFLHEPDDAGLTYWRQAYAGGARCYVIAKTFLNSAEFSSIKTAAGTNSSISRQIYLTRIYQGLLARDPDEAGLNYWLNDLAKGVSPSTIEEGFLQSSEFKDRWRSICP